MVNCYSSFYIVHYSLPIVHCTLFIVHCSLYIENMKLLLLIILVLFIGCSGQHSQEHQSSNPETGTENSTTEVQQAPIVPTQLIWDQAPHSAFTDLVYFRDRFYCTFREGDGHTPAKTGVDGAIRVIASSNGDHWESVAQLKVPDYDLRDPKISVTADGRLMVLMGGADYQGKQVMGRQCLVSFSKDGQTFNNPHAVRIDPKISNQRDWLWRVNWHQNTGYGVLYQGGEEEWDAYLVKTNNGVDYQLVTKLDIEGRPNEAAIKVLPNQQMLMIIRREGADQQGFLGSSHPPYQQWQWEAIGFRLGGPDFVVLPDNQLLMGSRIYTEDGHRTGLFLKPQGKSFEQVAVFPSDGDTSYPGMVLRNDSVFVSYYSGHQEKTAIYLASVSLAELTRMADS